MSRLKTTLLLAMTMLLVASLMTGPAGAQDSDEASILLFTKTAGFRHTQAINAGVPVFEALGAEHGFSVTRTEDETLFNDAYLAQFDAVVWFNTTGEVLNAQQKAAFERYIQAGGGYVGIHSASDTHRFGDWDWYHDLVGAFFVHHPPGEPNADLVVADQNHPSTSHLPTVWNRTDEWYNFDRNPRGNVHVLLTIDETTYNPGGPAMGHDHPMAWCHSYDGGRAWYTAGGHGGQHYSEPDFVEHLLGGVKWATGMEPGHCGGTVWDNYDVTTLYDDAVFPTELDVAPDGRVFFIEMGNRNTPSTEAALKVIDPDTNETTVVDTLNVYAGGPNTPPGTPGTQEDGLNGLALDPNFAQNNWVWLFYPPADGQVDCPPSESPGIPCGVYNLSRFTLTDTGLTDERITLQVPYQWGQCCHIGGSVLFDPEGDLWLTTGDDTNPFLSQAYSPINETPGNSPQDAQRTSGNTNDLRGSVLRITPQPDGTYTIPEGNLYAPGTPLTRAEIYAFGFRNPFRSEMNPYTGQLLVADYGPDAGSPNPNRGPQGRVEWNIVDEPGFYGWPYCHGTGVYIDWDFATQTAGEPFDCENGPVNDSPNNTGLTQLPPNIDPEVWYGRGTTGNTNGAIPPTGGAPMAGPVYQFDPDLDSDRKWPEYFDGKPLFYEWGSSPRRAFTFVLDDDDEVVKIDRIVPNIYSSTAARWHDMKFGPDGAMYVLDWRHGFGTAPNPVSLLRRIDWVGGPDCAGAAPDVGTRTVRIGGRDTGVRNVVVGGAGCSINQLIDDHVEWRSAGLFLRHLQQVSQYLLAEGVIDGRDRGALVSAAGRSNIGQPARRR